MFVYAQLLELNIVFTAWDFVIWDVFFMVRGYLRLRLTDICIYVKSSFNTYSKHPFVFALKYIDMPTSF